MSKSKCLETCGRVKKELNVIEGEVNFSETVSTGYGSCLELRIKNSDYKIWWQEQARMPAYIPVGSTLRGFYHKEENKVISLEAYELLDKDSKVLTRARRSGYEFIE